MTLRVRAIEHVRLRSSRDRSGVRRRWPSRGDGVKGPGLRAVTSRAEITSSHLSQRSTASSGWPQLSWTAAVGLERSSKYHLSLQRIATIRHARKSRPLSVGWYSGPDD